MVGIRSPDGLVVGLAPATLEFWVRFPNERNQGKQAHPVLKYRVPHGSHVIGPAVIKHTHSESSTWEGSLSPEYQVILTEIMHELKIQIQKLIILFRRR
jgi:hypothetical protein